MKIGIANDHRGVEVKEKLTKYLTDLGYDVVNYGTDVDGAVDYPEYAFKVGHAIREKEIDFGVLICLTGIGMSMACNKVRGVRCAKVSNVFEAEMTRIDNDANVVALSYKAPLEDLYEILKVFITTETSDHERHVRRRRMVDDYR